MMRTVTDSSLFVSVSARNPRRRLARPLTTGGTIGALAHLLASTVAGALVLGALATPALAAPLDTPVNPTAGWSAPRVVLPPAAAAPSRAVATLSGDRRSLVSSVSAESRIATLIGSRLGNAALGRTVGIQVADAATGRTIVARNANRALLPASNMKLVTAAGALSVLGEQHQLATTVVAGRSASEVVLVGGGDPLLSSADLRLLAYRTAKTLRASTNPPQRLVVRIDDSLFPSPTAAPGWRRGYQPSVVAPVRALTRDLRSSWDTGTDAGRYLAARLATTGLAVTYGGRVWSASWRGAALASTTHTVGAAVRLMLTVSQNDVAENLFRQVALGRGLPSTWAGASAAAQATLIELGVPTAAVALADGSGVSRSDRLTATALTGLLAAAVSPLHPELAQIYFGRALPVAGVSGTLKAHNGRFTTAPSRCARGAVLAKTGTLFDVVSLSGVTTGTDGQLKVFSVLVNNRPQRVSKLTTRRAVDGLAATVHGCY